MTAQKNPSPPAGKPPTGTAKESERKPWKKKSLPEIMAGQRDKLTEQIKEKEAEINDLKDQLAKFDEALKVFQK